MAQLSQFLGNGLLLSSFIHFKLDFKCLRKLFHVFYTNLPTDTQKNKKIIYLLPFFFLSNAKFIQIIKKNQASIHNVDSCGS